MPKNIQNRPYATTNQVLSYSWGVPGGISARLGYPETVVPEAELWMGSHPKAPSTVELESGATVALDGFDACRGESLPYLLKLLAVNEALSIQAHPSIEQAEAGFQRDNAACIKNPAAPRNYFDPYSKPEVIVSLESGFQALCGFRPETDSVKTLQSIAALSYVSPENSAAIEDFAARISEAGLKQTVSWALTDCPENTRQKAVTLAALGAVAELVDLGGAAHTLSADCIELLALLRTLGRKYPGDPGILVACLLNNVSLQHGEALWLPPGTPHAYLCGYGIEIMGPSDNVLRGGLTQKHVDTGELLRTLNFSSGAATRLLPVWRGKNCCFTPDPEGVFSVPFELLRAQESVTVASVAPLHIIVVSGGFAVTAGGRTLELGRGGTAFVPGGEVRLVGDGEAYIAAGAVTAWNTESQNGC